MQSHPWMHLLSELIFQDIAESVYRPCLFDIFLNSSNQIKDINNDKSNQNNNFC